MSGFPPYSLQTFLTNEPRLSFGCARSWLKNLLRERDQASANEPTSAKTIMMTKGAMNSGLEHPQSFSVAFVADVAGGEVACFRSQEIVVVVVVLVVWEFAEFWCMVRIERWDLAL